MGRGLVVGDSLWKLEAGRTGKEVGLVVGDSTWKLELGDVRCCVSLSPSVGTLNTSCAGLVGRKGDVDWRRRLEAEGDLGVEGGLG